MLYTTYFKYINKIPDNAIKLVITRYEPKNFNILNYDNLFICKELSPSKELINWYNSTNKDQESWEDYIVKFMSELCTRKDMINALQKIKIIDSKNIDVYLICYESNYKRCHRSIITRHLNNIYNIQSKEFKTHL